LDQSIALSSSQVNAPTHGDDDTNGLRQPLARSATRAARSRKSWKEELVVIVVFRGGLSQEDQEYRNAPRRGKLFAKQIRILPEPLYSRAVANL
jgi:hypothetical protein